MIHGEWRPKKAKALFSQVFLFLANGMLFHFPKAPLTIREDYKYILFGKFTKLILFNGVHLKAT